MLDHVCNLLECHILTLDHQTAYDTLSLLEQVNKLSSELGNLISLVADLLLELDGLIHLGQGVLGNGKTLVEAGGNISGVTLEGDLVVLADLVVQVEKCFGGFDAFGEFSEDGVVDEFDNLGDGSGRHVERALFDRWIWAVRRRLRDGQRQA